MPGYTGTHSLADLQAATVVGQIDDAAVQRSLEAEIATLNTVVRDELSDLVEVTTDVRRSYGGGARGKMNRGDEFARAQTQKGSVTGEVAFPFHKHIYATGWDEDFRRLASPSKYAQVFIGARRAYLSELQDEMKLALFGPTNFTFSDYMATKLDLPVKRLLNADGAPIPLGPNGETFDGTSHTHYLATSSVSAASFDALVRTVVEHGNGGDVRVYINQADEATVANLTGFVRAQPATVLVGNGATQTNFALDTTRLNNRRIGVLANGAVVWTKPWVLAGYSFAYDAASGDKPLVIREDLAGSSALALSQLINLTPLSAQHFVARFGVGVNARANGAILDFGHSTYTDPTA